MGDRQSAVALGLTEVAALSSLPTLDHPARRGATFPNPRDEVCTWRDAAQLAKTDGVLTSVVVAVHRELSETLAHAEPKRRICEPRDADDPIECGLVGCRQYDERLVVPY